MTETQETVVLQKGEEFLTQGPRRFYRLQSGAIHVFIVPIESGKQGTPVLFCRIQDSDRNKSVPPLIHREGERSWHLSIRAIDGEAVLSVSDKLTKPLYMNFLKCGKVTGEAGFENSLITFYQRNLPTSQAEQAPQKTATPAVGEDILLTATEQHLTRSGEDAYLLRRGSVYVDIVPLVNGRSGKAVHYCQLDTSDKPVIIPALAYRGFDHKYWCLQIRAVGEEAQLIRIPNGSTEVIQKDFLARRDIQTYDKEGFNVSLTEFYKREELSGKAIIINTERKKESSLSDTYKALRFVCDLMDIPLISEADLRATCSKDPDILEIARASHFICRKVTLDADWQQHDCGGFIGTLDNSELQEQKEKRRCPQKEVVACAPDKKGRYQLYHSFDGTVEPLTPELANRIFPSAWSLGRTLPLKSLTQKDVYRFCAKSIHFRDLTPYIILVILCALIGVLLPTLNGMLYDDYIPVGNVGNLVQICMLILSFMVGNLAFSIVKNLFGYRITSQVSNELQNAVYHRLFHLPESFFRDYDSADLAGRISGIGNVASRYANALILSSISALFSVFYLIRMFRYSKKLTWVSIAVYLVYLVISVAITAAAKRGQLRIAEAESQASSKLYQYLNGVDKIRMAGVEDRARDSYMQPYLQQQLEEIKVNRLISVEEALTTVVQSLFSMVLYWFIVKKLGNDSFSIGNFVAFNSAFGSFTGALGSLVDEVLLLFQEKSEVKRFWPVFEVVPEDDDAMEVAGALTGELIVEHATFAYSKDSKNVLNDLSIHIRPGEYVGIVGSSGCGKSTLLKLLLGFESPQSGRVLVNGKDLKTLNKGAYRRQLGVVLQNGQLISGSIYENITITAPNATMTRVNEVVEQVGLKADIAQMPMGLHTMLGENSNTISGGQKQRILIARAICGSPKILIFDEATSALDNLTQAAVSSSLDKMNVTRIVVAHRLSTIKNCDRILVMDHGTIIQEGNYETLMADHQGLFYRLASRQIAQ